MASAPACGRGSLAISRPAPAASRRDSPSGRLDREHGQRTSVTGGSGALGLRALLAESHYLLARDLELAGKAADAPEHYKQARKILDEIQKDAKTDSIVNRSDLLPIYAHSIS